MNTEVLQIVAAALIQNRQNGLYNEYLFIKSDKILGKTLKQDWNSRNTLKDCEKQIHFTSC